VSGRRIQSRRRGRAVGLGGVLVERDAELAAIERRLAQTREGDGGVVFVEAHAGMGKSRLLTVAGDLAREAGMQVAGAQGTRLEQDFPFGLAIQLFEPRWISADAAERERLLQGPARWAGQLLAGSTVQMGPFPGDQGYAVIHGLFRLACSLATPADDTDSARPLVMLVDDAQWADQPSLRFLAYLAQRIADLPIALVIAVREGELSSDRPALAALGNAADDNVLRPDRLSEDGVGAVVRDRFPDAEAAFWRACARVTDGNPFLLIGLLDQVGVNGAAPNAATGASLADLAPESVLYAVVSRLEAMPSEVRDVARALAILGDGAPVRRVALLAGLEVEAAVQAASTLAELHIFHAEAPLSFVHPLVAASVRESMSPLARGQAHRRAAEILSEHDAPDEEIAAHLLMAPPDSDPEALALLRTAARRALASGASETAVRILERALAEHPTNDTYSELLGELGEAELQAGLPEAAARLQHAIEVTHEPPRRAQLALSQGGALYDQRRYRESALVLAGTLAEPGECEDGLADELKAAYIAAASFVPDLRDELEMRRAELVASTTENVGDGQRRAFAHLALLAGMQGEDRATVADLADRAWGDGRLLVDDSPHRLSWPLVANALLFVDELERDIEICDAALVASQAGDSAAASAMASYCRAWPLYKQGRIVEALAEARAALEARPANWQVHVRTAYGAVAACHIARGELDQAETGLMIVGDAELRDTVHVPFLLDLRAQLRLAQVRPQDALVDALEAGRLCESGLGLNNPGAIAWRSTAAFAHLAMGEPNEARELATEELERARRGDVTSVVIRDMRILGLIERGRRGIDLLSDAVTIGEGGPPRLEYVHALVDLGAALRRANHRSAARDPLRKGLELSYRGGATALADVARTELAATGARPRRAILTGLDSLTPSELRVAELAGNGLTTRQIAERLFVTPKTIEFHIRHIYRKLDVGSRAELAAVMDDGNVDRAKAG
jgi:DNA-binding CsgD family transcriptional regulator/tetratricopeptide (TPR) repeat protein